MALHVGRRSATEAPESNEWLFGKEVVGIGLHEMDDHDGSNDELGGVPSMKPRDGKRRHRATDKEGKAKSYFNVGSKKDSLPGRGTANGKGEYENLLSGSFENVPVSTSATSQFYGSKAQPHQQHHHTVSKYSGVLPGGSSRPPSVAEEVFEFDDPSKRQHWVSLSPNGLGDSESPIEEFKQSLGGHRKKKATSTRKKRQQAFVQSDTDHGGHGASGSEAGGPQRRATSSLHGKQPSASLAKSDNCVSTAGGSEDISCAETSSVVDGLRGVEQSEGQRAKRSGLNSRKRSSRSEKRQNHHQREPSFTESADATPISKSIVGSLPPLGLVGGNGSPGSSTLDPPLVSHASVNTSVLQEPLSYMQGGSRTLASLGALPPISHQPVSPRTRSKHKMSFA